MVARFGVDQDGSAAIEFWQEKTETKGLTPPVSGVESRKTSAVVEQIAEALGTYGPVTIPRVTRLIADSHGPAEKVLEALAVVKPPESARDPLAWVLSMVLEYLAGRYTPEFPKKKISVRDQRMADAFRMSREIKEGKIA